MLKRFTTSLAISSLIVVGYANATTNEAMPAPLIDTQLRDPLQGEQITNTEISEVVKKHFKSNLEKIMVEEKTPKKDRRKLSKDDDSESDYDDEDDNTKGDKRKSFSDKKKPEKKDKKKPSKNEKEDGNNRKERKDKSRD